VRICARQQQIFTARPLQVLRLLLLGRSGASRDIAVLVSRRLDSRLQIKIKPKASATKAAGYFLLSKATKER
jgi:hypothetical protein